MTRFPTSSTQLRCNPCDAISGVDESLIAYEELAKKPVGDIEEGIGMLMDMVTLADLGVIKVNPW